jgi:hypothetical protein
MWATPEQSSSEVLGWFRYSCDRADETVAELDLDAAGFVPWWGPERGHVTLQQVLVHLVAEVARHAGHADILRESIDGAAGRRPGDPSFPGKSDEEWAAWRERIEAAARAAGEPPPVSGS